MSCLGALIPVSGRAIAGAIVQTVNARELHAFLGSNPKHQPSLLMQNQQTKELVDKISNSRNSLNLAPAKSTAGRKGGTYVCKELVYAYAMWIKPSEPHQVGFSCFKQLGVRGDEEKPELVKFGLGLLWLALIADIAHKLVNVYFYREKLDVGIFVAWGGMATVLFLIGRCHNWARFIYAIAFFPICVQSVPLLVASLRRFPAPTVIGILSVCAIVGGTAMLFLPESSRWFNRKGGDGNAQNTSRES